MRERKQVRTKMQKEKGENRTDGSAKDLGGPKGCGEA
jgi:hypothetical protein